MQSSKTKLFFYVYFLVTVGSEFTNTATPSDNNTFIVSPEVTAEHGTDKSDVQSSSGDKTSSSISTISRTASPPTPLETVTTSPPQHGIQPRSFDNRPHCLTHRAAAGQMIMVSFHLDGDDVIKRYIDEYSFDPWECYHDFLNLYEGGSCNGYNTWSLCHFSFPETRLYNTSVVSLHFGYSDPDPFPPFRVEFSSFNASDPPQKLSDGRWNCSKRHWEGLKTHFLCNQDVECVDSRDEKNCSSIVNGCATGQVRIGNKCYLFSRQKADESVSWQNMSDRCALRGGRLPNMVTPEEWESVWGFLTQKQFNWVFVGLRSATPALPYMYHREWHWTEGNSAFYVNIDSSFIEPPVCLGFVFRTKYHVAFIYERLSGDINSIRSMLPRALEIIRCEGKTSAALLCEMKTLPETNGSFTDDKPSTISFQTPQVTNTRAHLVSCPDSHMTHNFLVCDVRSSCWTRHYGTEASCDATLTPLPPSFTCKNEIERVPYTLVCDHRPDCNDGSDESFCAFKKCDPTVYFLCSNNQECILREQVCDGVPQCISGVDEDYCGEYPEKRYNYTPPPPPALVTLDAYGWFNIEQMHNFTSCPETHFQCPVDGYCLPVYMRCNGVYDCPGREDEAECNSYTCPGFYRCRASTICVHPEQMCDGVLQCPQLDDEIFCGARPCPAGCTCYGLAYFCARPFPASTIPELRFLDASGSGMSPSDLANNSMLVFLSLARCGVTDLPALDLANLHTLDVSHNKLTHIKGGRLQKLRHLRDLYLAGNPITSLVSLATPGLTFSSLKTLDVSRLEMKELEQIVLKVIPAVRTLNLSDSGLTHLPTEGFQSLKQLRVLDIRGCPVTVLPRDVFLGLTDLSSVFADNFKFCCSATLPEGFNPNNCRAPRDEISSCESLLRSETFRAFLSVFAVLAVLGNSCSFVYRVFIKNVAENMGFDVFVTHLSMSDLLMGVYLAIIGVADRLYLGSYLWEDTLWRKSVACKVAGFLSLLSNEVSAFIICLITVERFLVVRFPFSNIRFRRRSAQLACALAWCVGHVLSLMPLIPATSHWQFYSQTGICIPLPITRNDFPGNSYSYGVLIILNFVLFVLIAMGQLLIYWSIRQNEMSSVDSSRTSKDFTIARRLVTIVVSDFLCWFPIGILGLIAANGVPVPGEANIVVAIFVLPLNSALNPFLYTLNVIMERRRKAEEERMLKTFTSHLADSKYGVPTISKPHLAKTPDEAWKLLEQFLKSGVVSSDDVVQCFDETQKEEKEITDPEDS